MHKKLTGTVPLRSHRLRLLFHSSPPSFFKFPNKTTVALVLLSVSFVAETLDPTITTTPHHFHLCNHLLHRRLPHPPLLTTTITIYTDAHHHRHLTRRSLRAAHTFSFCHCHMSSEFFLNQIVTMYSVKKLAAKRCWDIAEMRAKSDRQLLKILVNLAMEVGYSEKVDEPCDKYSLEGFMKAKERPTSSMGEQFVATLLMAEQRELTVDVDGFNVSMNEARERSRNAQNKQAVVTVLMGATALHEYVECASVGDDIFDTGLLGGPSRTFKLLNVQLYVGYMEDSNDDGVPIVFPYSRNSRIIFKDKRLVSDRYNQTHQKMQPNPDRYAYSSMNREAGKNRELGASAVAMATVRPAGDGGDGKILRHGAGDDLA
ncbi:hypothetical protein LXL04_024600 [Taraxacum kok-saghyz]